MKRLILLLAIGLASCEKEPLPRYQPGDVVVATETILTPHARRDSILPGEEGVIMLITGFDPITYKVVWNERFPVWPPSAGIKGKPSVKSTVLENQISQ